MWCRLDWEYRALYNEEMKTSMSNVALIPIDNRMIKNSKPIAHCAKLFQLEYSKT